MCLEAQTKIMLVYVCAIVDTGARTVLTSAPEAEINPATIMATVTSEQGPVSVI